MYKDETIGNFLEQLASTDPVPGGGATCALSGAVLTTLLEKIVNLTYRRKKNDRLLQRAKRLKKIREQFLDFMDLDAKNYLSLREAYQIKANTKEEKEKKKKAILKASKKACEVPFKVIDLLEKVAVIQKEILDVCSLDLLSDFSITIQYGNSTLAGVVDLLEVNNLEESTYDKKFALLFETALYKMTNLMMEYDSMIYTIEDLQDDF